MLVLAAGATLGIILYWAGASLYQNLVLQPNQTNQVSQSTLDELEIRIAGLESQIKDNQARLNDLETAQSQQALKISDLQGQIQIAQALLEEHSTSLEALARIQSDLDTLTTDSAAQSEVLSALTGPDSALQTLQMNVKILEAMELIERSRTYLVNNDAGSAGRGC